MIPAAFLCIGVILGMLFQRWLDRRHAWGRLPRIMAEVDSLRTYLKQPDDPGMRH